MASSDADVCTQALVLIGQTGISSLADTDNKSVTCANIYPTTKAALLLEHPWRFNMQKGQLVRLVATPENEWTFAFQMPSDRLGTAYAIFNSGEVGAAPFKEWERFGDQIYSDATVLWIDYQVDRIVPELPPYFIQLLVYELAWKFADPFTSDDVKTQKFFRIARGPDADEGRGGYFATARNIDAKGSPSQGLAGNDFSLIAARAGGL